MKKKVALYNLGCKVNAYELEAMRQMLLDSDYEIVPFNTVADAYIINTCTVTNVADRKSRQMLHKAKKTNPQSVVVAVGCYAQAEGDKLVKDDAVDIIVGNNKKKELPAILAGYFAENGEVQVVEDIGATDEYEELNISDSGEYTRAYIKVQDGCNQFCTYCIIPYMRGRVRSRKIEDVLKEVKRLAAADYKEIVLTGIHLSSYGVERGEKDGLLELIKAVHQVNDIKRIRLGSLEPGIVSENFASEISKLEKVCPHFHLSLQSGCDETLKRMKRRYNTQEFKEKCSILRKYYDKVAITTDIIAGFPGETIEEFEETKHFVREIGFYETHIFKYSPRKGTKAAEMPAQVPEATKSERSKTLIAIGTENKRAFVTAFLGEKLEILVEEKVKVQGQEYWSGHTKEYLKVLVRTKEDLTGKFVSVVAKDIVDEEYIYGEIS